MSKDRSQKLQKVLAEQGLGSRRRMEEWIASGRIEVNGQRAKLGQRVEASDHIRVDGKRLTTHSQTLGHHSRVLLYHKPVGHVCTREDPEDRPTIYTRLPQLKKGRWISVGRLDLQTSGLILLTNDGQLAHQLMHPSTGLEREYLVRVFGVVRSETLTRLMRGVRLDDGRGKFDQIKPHTTVQDVAHNQELATERRAQNSWFRVIVSEGRNQFVRRMWQAQNCQVTRLSRIRFGPLKLPKHLSKGHCIELSSDEVATLKSLVGSKPS